MNQKMNGASTPADLARELAGLRAQKALREEQLKTINGELAAVNTKLVDAMQVLGLQKFSVDGVGMVYLQDRPHPTVLDADKLHAWLRAHGHGGMVKEGVHPMTLQAWVKEQMSNMVALPEDAIKVFIETRVMFRKE